MREFETERQRDRDRDKEIEANRFGFRLRCCLLFFSYMSLSNPQLFFFSISFHHLLFLSIFFFFFFLVSRSSSLFGSYLLVEVGPRRRLDLIVDGHNDLFVNKATVYFGSRARLVERLIQDLHVATAWLMSYVGFYNQIYILN